MIVAFLWQASAFPFPLQYVSCGANAEGGLFGRNCGLMCACLAWQRKRGRTPASTGHTVSCSSSW